MAKSQKSAPKKKEKEIELDPDAWPKFEALIKSAAKMGPKPHAPVTKKEPKKKSAG